MPVVVRRSINSSSCSICSSKIEGNTTAPAPRSSSCRILSYIPGERAGSGQQRAAQIEAQVARCQIHREIAPSAVWLGDFQRFCYCCSYLSGRRAAAKLGEFLIGAVFLRRRPLAPDATIPQPRPAETMRETDTGARYRRTP